MDNNNSPGSNPIYWRKKKPERLPPAKLMRTEMREVHGQMVEVQIWSAGPSAKGGDLAPKIANGEIAGEQVIAVREAIVQRERAHYEPQMDLSRIGLPVQK